jgi:6-pyruvoyltetrahydropterin/6-carboxytetrahydropterin synthase
METHLITRRIGIDMGHRVPDHGSKCRNLHGHRYEIEATCEGPLADIGEQRGMVLDFGFLKSAMMDVIDAQFDHALCLSRYDPMLDSIVDNVLKPFRQKHVIVPFTPTAENLARHWFMLLTPKVHSRSDGRARLTEVKVWETPNGTATYRVDR